MANAANANADILKRETLTVEIAYSDLPADATTTKMDEDVLKVDLRVAGAAS